MWPVKIAARSLKFTCNDYPASVAHVKGKVKRRSKGWMRNAGGLGTDEIPSQASYAIGLNRATSPAQCLPATFTELSSAATRGWI
jgi:hypothetical protein